MKALLIILFSSIIIKSQVTIYENNDYLPGLCSDIIYIQDSTFVLLEGGCEGSSSPKIFNSIYIKDTLQLTQLLDYNSYNFIKKLDISNRKQKKNIELNFYDLNGKNINEYVSIKVTYKNKMKYIYGISDYRNLNVPNKYQESKEEILFRPKDFKKNISIKRKNLEKIEILKFQNIWNYIFEIEIDKNYDSEITLYLPSSFFYYKDLYQTKEDQLKLLKNGNDYELLDMEYENVEKIIFKLKE